MRRLGILLVGVLVLFPARAGAQDLTGRAIALDGDSLEIAGRRIRLSGIDAPEASQTCRALDKTWDCGREATFALAFEIGSHWVACNGRGFDADGALVAVCTVGPYDLAERMVRKGWAVVDQGSADAAGYRDAQRQAQDFGSGIWRGAFVPPWEWRKGIR